jgi:biopolymer transport protein ExbD
MAMTGGKMGDMKSDINITPLVDVVLVLLIIFMVVTPLLQRGYETKVPPKTTGPSLPVSSDQIVIRLAVDGGIFINRDQFTEREFPAKLAEIMRGRESKVAFFAADGDIPYERVAAFMDLCNENGAKNLGIVLDDIAPAGTTAGS